MVDPLAEVVSLLQPAARYSKRISAAGRWSVRRTEFSDPFYCAMLEGEACLQVDGQSPLALRAGDFALIPSAQAFTLCSRIPPDADEPCPAPLQVAPGEFQLGDPQAIVDTRHLIGHFCFGAPDARLLVSLLPQIVRVHGNARLSTLVHLLGDESRHQRPAREMVLARLLEVLLIEALRSMSAAEAAESDADAGSTHANQPPPGLVRALADPRLAGALRQLHAHPGHPWTVVALARHAALSRSRFFERFQQALGVTPMDYLQTWRMAQARQLLHDNHKSLSAIAEQLGYSSASTFSTAFTRHTGMPPGRYAQQRQKWQRAALEP